MDPVSVANIVGAASNVGGTFDQLQLHSVDGYFSAVFRARHIPTGAPCALKFLAHRGDAGRQLAFEREGRLLSTVLAGQAQFVSLVTPPAKHVQNLTTPTGVSIQFEFPYLALEWHGRGTVEAVTGSCPRGHAELLNRLALVKSMARAVARAHFLGVRHRDVKPSNFLLSSRNTVKLADFGSALVTSEVDHHYQAPPRGDLRYTAPEMLLDVSWPAEVTLGADVYSLGCSAFELITGRPFVGHNTFGAFARVFDFRRLVLTFPATTRVANYHAYLGRPQSRFPDLRLINPDLPRCSYPALTELLESMCHFDYRARERSFVRIQRLISIANLVVSNEHRSISRIRARRARRQVTV